MVATDLDVDDLVWAKMKGYPPWPAKIAPTTNVKIPKNLKKPQHYVYFFGTHNNAWILDELITPHSEEMLENSKMYKKIPASMQLAIKEIQSECPKPPKKSSKVPSTGEEPLPQKSTEAETSAERKPKTPKKSISKTPKKGGKKRPISDVSPNDFESVAKKQSPKKTPKKSKVSDVASNDLESVTSSVEDLNENVDEDYSQLMANVPPNNGHSKVAVINPYNSIQPATLIDRQFYERPPTPILDIDTPTENLLKKKIQATKKKIGFLGLGAMGRGMVKNLLNSGHKVTVWNRSSEKCTEFQRAGAEMAETPCDVVQSCDITFCCVTDPTAAKMLVFDNCGILKGLDGCNSGTKGYVEMTSIDPITSQEIAEAITDKGGRYLEAPIIGSRQLAEEGSLLILGAGDRDLFNDCETCFFALSKNAYYLGCNVGNGSKMNLVLSMLAGTAYAALAEAMTLVERCKLSGDNFLEILSLGPLSCPLLMNKGQAMLENNYETNTALKHQQKDLYLALMLGNSFEQPLSLTAAANEIFKRAKRLRYAEHDVAAVHLGTKL